MSKLPQIRDVMTSSPHTIEIYETIKNAKSLMARYEIKHLPVMADGHIVGLLSDRDIKLAQAVSSDTDFHNNALVRDVYLPDPFIVSKSEPLNLVLLEMVNRAVGSVIVTDKNKLVGIFTSTDACAAFAEFIQQQYTYTENR